MRSKEEYRVLKPLRLNGKKIKTAEQFKVISAVLTARRSMRELRSRWLIPESDDMGSFQERTQAYSDRTNRLSTALEAFEYRGAINNIANRYAGLSTPSLKDTKAIQDEVLQVQRVSIRHDLEQTTSAIEEQARTLSGQITERSNFSIFSKLKNAIESRSPERYEAAIAELRVLAENKTRIRALDDTAASLATHLPNLVVHIQMNPTDESWEHRLSNIEKAWGWAQTNAWLKARDLEANEMSLAEHIRQSDREIAQATSELASLRGWSMCLSRLTNEIRQNMVAWQHSMERLGKGTGKHAAKHRREAQQYLMRCQTAVPGWIMPVHRVWDTVTPQPDAFDAIIVDEASQCGFESYPLLFLSSKVLIVGDNQQISPEAVGINSEVVEQLQREFLDDFRFKSYFGPDSSLFDQGQLRYGQKRIVLREHFRCMPEIIKFSNDLSYRDTPLIPLRQYGPDRLEPLVNRFVDGGFVKGTNQAIINEPEAEALVDEIVSLCENPRYNGLTMGVIALQGRAQADLISSLLLQQIGADEYEKRRIVCGNAYSFQGDERDVIFISMVAAPNQRFASLTKSTDKRRFNVAASRAKDQMFLFHSVREEDLGANCLRRRLLSHFHRKQEGTENPEFSEWEQQGLRANRQLEKAPSPFDSWFELDVALEIIRKGYSIQPQFSVAGHRIDIVIEGGKARLAVECDGDHWHGPDRYDADMTRQRKLERCGWTFHRIRESSFNADRDSALKKLWEACDRLGLQLANQQPEKPDADRSDRDENDNKNHSKPTDPTSQQPKQPALNQTAESGAKTPKPEEPGDQNDLFHDAPTDDGDGTTVDRRRPGDVTPSEIRETVVTVLAKRPNQSCKLDDVSGHVLKELNILTRSGPREKFDQRTRRAVTELVRKGQVELYKAKNQRVRLVR